MHDPDALLDDLHRSTISLRSVAKRHAMTVRDLATWAEKAENARALAVLRDLSDSRAALIVSRSRVAAARNLLRIANDRNNTETARKACVDLFNLRTRTVAPDPQDTKAPSSRDTDSAVRSLLAKLAHSTADASGGKAS